MSVGRAGAARVGQLRSLVAFQKSESNTIGYVGWDGNGNVGDDSIRVTHAFTLLPVRLESLPTGRRYLSLLGRLQDIGLLGPSSVLLGGGTLLGRPSWRRIIEQGVNALKGVPWLGIGLGVESPEFRGLAGQDYSEEIYQWREVLSRFHSITVRGPHSQEILARVGIDARVTGDPALRLPDYLPPSRVEPGRICISVASPEDRWPGGDPNEALAGLVKALVAKGWEPSLVVFDRVDRPAAESLAAELGETVSLVDVSSSVEDAVRIVSSCQLTVAYRLHAGVIAAAYGRPFACIAYRPKVLDFAASIGWDEFALPVEGLAAGHLLDLVDHLEAGATLYTQRIRTSVDLLTRSAAPSLDRSYDVLRGSKPN